MKKFEYQTINSKLKTLPYENGIDNLNFLGNKGWQLVFVSRFDKTEWWTLMREKQNAD